MSRHRASSFINIYGLNYCADHTNGNVYEYSLDIYTDNGDPIIKQRDTAVIHGGLFGAPGKKLFIDEVEFIIVSGQTLVEGTGLGPQPPITVTIPLTNCNEAWSYGVLTPDLHVAGMSDVGVWDSDVLQGIGVLTDDHLSNMYVPNITGNYDNAGNGAVAAMGIVDCQRYIYSGPRIENEIQIPTCNLSNGVGWTLSGTGTVTFNQTGIDETANTASLVTDSDAAAMFTTYVQTPLNKVKLNGEPITGCAIVKKDLTATKYARLTLATVSGANLIFIYFHPGTGVINFGGSIGTGGAYEILDRGDWWEVYLSINKASGGSQTQAYFYVYPTASTDGTTDDVTATGAITVGHTVVADGWSLPEIRGACTIRSTTAGALTVNETDTYLDITNHDNTEGGYFIEIRPMFSHSEISADFEILSLNGAAGLLYYDYSAAAFASTDGVNTATIAVTLTKDTKYRVGVIYGSSTMRVGVDGVWGTYVPYDGGFTLGTRLDIMRSPWGAVYWRELRGFQTLYSTAYTEIQRLMLGNSVVGEVLPPPPAPEPTTVIAAPYWTTDGIVTGNSITLADLTSVTFATLYGVAIEDADFNAVFAVTGKRALVNTADAGNRLQIQQSIDCNYASLYVCNASGDVVDSMTYIGVPNGDSVLVPTGANYYIIAASDTGNVKIKKWDSSAVSVAGAVSWDSFFGLPLATTRVLYDVEKVIPAAGQPIWFTVPSTASPYKLSFTTIETTSTPGTTRTGSVNQTVGDYTSDPTYTWGIGGGIDCGINYSTAVDIELTPGQTYIFNVRNDSPTGNNWVRVQATLVAQ